MTDFDPGLRVTSSGVVHLPTCSHVKRPGSGATPWAYRLSHDRPCSVCRPTFPEHRPATTHRPETTTDAREANPHG